MTEFVELTRREILVGNYEYPTHSVHLIFTDHAIERAEERIGANFVFPKHATVTQDNIYSGKTKDGKRLTSVVIRMDYTMIEDLYLCFNPYDGGVKSIWLTDAKRFKKHANISQTPNYKEGSKRTVQAHQ